MTKGSLRKLLNLGFPDSRILSVVFGRGGSPQVLSPKHSPPSPLCLASWPGTHCFWGEDIWGWAQEFRITMSYFDLISPWALIYPQEMLCPINCSQHHKSRYTPRPTPLYRQRNYVTGEGPGLSWPVTGSGREPAPV